MRSIVRLSNILGVGPNEGRSLATGKPGVSEGSASESVMSCLNFGGFTEYDGVVVAKGLAIMIHNR